MPIYEFQCPKCGNRRETIAPQTSEDGEYPKSRCQRCSEDFEHVVWMKRVPSAPAVIRIK